jgi:hypothetical protein
MAHLLVTMKVMEVKTWAELLDCAVDKIDSNRLMMKSKLINNNNKMLLHWEIRLGLEDLIIEKHRLREL